VKYDLTGKTTFDVGGGARYITTSNIHAPNVTGLRPAWAFGITYAPTEKTSMSAGFGEQGADIVPEVNLILNWNPREKTQFSLSVNQSEGFANAVSAQYLVTRSILGTVTQKLFSSVDLQVSGGYGSQYYISLSNGTPAQSNYQTPPHYLMATTTLNWKIHDWLSLNNTLSYSGAQTQPGPNGSMIPQAFYSISLNFSL